MLANIPRCKVSYQQAVESIRCTHVIVFTNRRNKFHILGETKK